MNYGREFNKKGLHHLKRKQVRRFKKYIKYLEKMVKESQLKQARSLMMANLLHQQLLVERQYKWIVPFWIAILKDKWRTWRAKKANLQSQQPDKVSAS